VVGEFQIYYVGFGTCKFSFKFCHQLILSLLVFFSITYIAYCYHYYKFQFICNTPSFERTEGFRHIQNEPKGFQKLFSLPFSVAFVELLLCFCSKRSSFAF
jgi:hypothetical protein